MLKRLQFIMFGKRKKIKEPARRIAGVILESKNTVVLTGAGLSTESGIPDFRSPRSGIWTKFSAELMTSDFLYSNPEEFYRQGRKLLDFLTQISDATPNKAHLVLAEMEKHGLISAIVTQNIDGLHQKAGSEKVFEIHGNLTSSYCISCGEKESFDFLAESIMNDIIPPKCPGCGGVMRPDLVLFGDLLPDSFEKARDEIAGSGLLLVIGSSLNVTPANTLTELASKFVIINRERTYYDRRALIVWNYEIGDALDEIYDWVKKIRNKTENQYI